MSHIQKIDYSFGTGYQVRWGKQGAGQTCLFLSSSFGSDEKAHLNAINFKEAVDLDESYKLPTKSIKGICLTWMKKPSGNLYPYIRGNYKAEGGKEKKVNISVETHGLKGAIEKMIQLRKQGGAEAPTIDECLNFFRL